MIEAYLDSRTIHERKHEVVNKAGLILMTLAGIGMSMVANFQELNVDQLHYTGAAMTFGLGGIYILGRVKLADRKKNKVKREEPRTTARIAHLESYK